MKRLIALLLLCVLCTACALPAYAVGEMTSVDASATEIPIWDAQDMLKISENPDATYRLMRDIDMSGVRWSSPAFSGIFHGNGHAILNLEITTPGKEEFPVLAKNENSVDCVGAGLFGVMHGGRVDYLTLLGVHSDLSASENTFLGAIAGAAFESSFENCAVVGDLKLSGDGYYGLGGLVGYGSVSMTQCKAVVTLVCHDANTETADAAYLGGMLAYGFPVMLSCQADLDAYMGAKGTTYSGGLVGVMLQYTLMQNGKAEVSTCIADGRITAMELSLAPRVEVGQAVAKIYKTWNYKVDTPVGKLETHVSQNQEKLPSPEQCENPVYVEELYDPDCDIFGYSEFVCSGCGYKFRRDYTLKDHRVSEWKPHAALPDMMEGDCAICEAKVYEWHANIPELQVEEPRPIETTYPEVETTPQVDVLEQTTHDFTYALAWGFLILALATAGGLGVYVIKMRKK